MMCCCVLCLLLLVYDNMLSGRLENIRSSSKAPEKHQTINDLAFVKTLASATSVIYLNPGSATLFVLFSAVVGVFIELSTTN